MTYFLIPYSANAPSNGLIEYRVPIPLSNIEFWVEVDSFADGGAGGSFTVFITKNGVQANIGVNMFSTGAFASSPGPVAFSPGDRFGLAMNVSGTVGVFVDFTVFVRGII